MQRSSTAGRPSQINRAMMLRDAVAEAVTAEQEFQKKSVRKQSSARFAALMAIAALLIAFSIYSWVARPAFIWGPPAKPLPQAEVDANLRMTLFLLGMRLDAYREEQGFYPASLEALGESISGVTYELVSDSVFELRGMAGRMPVVLRSDMSADEYLGNTREILSNRQKR